MNEQYLNQTIRRIVYLESLKQSEINNLSAHLIELDPDYFKQNRPHLTVGFFNRS